MREFDTSPRGSTSDMHTAAENKLIYQNQIPDTFRGENLHKMTVLSDEPPLLLLNTILVTVHIWMSHLRKMSYACIRTTVVSGIITQ